MHEGEILGSREKIDKKVGRRRNRVRKEIEGKKRGYSQGEKDNCGRRVKRLIERMGKRGNGGGREMETGRHVLIC